MGRVLVTLAVLGLLAYLITLWWSRRETPAQRSARQLREARDRLALDREQLEHYERSARQVPPQRVLPYTEKDDLDR